MPSPEYQTLRDSLTFTGRPQVECDGSAIKTDFFASHNQIFLTHTRDILNTLEDLAASAQETDRQNQGRLADLFRMATTVVTVNTKIEKTSDGDIFLTQTDKFQDEAGVVIYGAIVLDTDQTVTIVDSTLSSTRNAYLKRIAVLTKVTDEAGTERIIGRFFTHETSLDTAGQIDTPPVNFGS